MSYKVYGPSVSVGIGEQRTLDAAVGIYLDAKSRFPNASAKTMRRWKRQLDLREENERVRKLRETIG